MNSTTASVSWMHEKQAQLLEMEWDWRLLHEQTGLRHSGAGAALTTRAMEEKEAEVGRLRAELAVASFIEEFYTCRDTARGQRLIASADMRAWRQPRLTREHFTQFVKAEMELLGHGHSTVCWDAPTATEGGTEGDWWIDIDARWAQVGQPIDRRYRFHVVDNQVDAWVIFPAAQ